MFRLLAIGLLVECVKVGGLRLRRPPPRIIGRYSDWLGKKILDSSTLRFPASSTSLSRAAQLGGNALRMDRQLVQIQECSLLGQPLSRSPFLQELIVVSWRKAVGAIGKGCENLETTKFLRIGAFDRLAD